MSQDEKLDAIYGLLIEQKHDLVTLSKNQAKIQQCNDNASMLILNNILKEGSSFDRTTLGNCFDDNEINLIV